MVNRKTLLGLSALTAASTACVKPAFAQTPSPTAEWQYSSGIQLEKLFMPTVPKWEIELGLGSSFQPAAPGLKRYTVQGGPAIDIRYKDLAFLSTGEGLGVNVISTSYFSAGTAVTYDMGRAPHVDRKVLNGMGTIHAAPEIKLFATAVLSKSFPLTLRLNIRKQLGGSNGYIGDAGLYMPMPGSSEKFVWFVGPSVTFADTRYMNTWFGVSHKQTQSTNYQYYKAHGGLDSAGIGLTANYFVTKSVILNVTATYSRLLGSATDSPVTRTNDQANLSLAALYKF